MKKSLFSLLQAFGVIQLAAWWNRKRVMMLCYHGVTRRSEPSPDDPHGLHVCVDRFIAQLDYLQEQYRVISLREYLTARREGKPLPDRSVVLTFDDGFRNFFTVAAPILVERRMPVTVLLITDRIRRESEANLDHCWAPNDDEAYLSWREVRSLAQEKGIEFGSHTCSHPKLSSLSTQDVERELRDSGSVIAAHLGEVSTPFAYPYGDHSDSVVERVHSSGYVCALTTEEGANAEDAGLFTLRRTLIGDGDEGPVFAARVSGLSGLLSKVRNRLRGSTKSQWQANPAKEFPIASSEQAR